MSQQHTVPLPGTQWSVWRWAMLRSAGFPVDGPAQLGAAMCAQVADAYLFRQADDAEFDAALVEATMAASARAREVASDPLFQSAVLWQNPTAARVLSSLQARDQDAHGHQSRRREESLAKYWQRYCVKNDTTGFFGPVCWVRVDGRGFVESSHGPSLVRERRVYFERWALLEVARRFAEDPRAKPWLPAMRQPHVSIRGRLLLVPGRKPTPLPVADALVLSRCEGREPVGRWAAELVAGESSPFRAEQDVYDLIDHYVELGVLRWGPELPMDLRAEDVLQRWIATIGAAGLRSEFERAFGRLCARRRELADASSPDQIFAAMTALAEEFSAVTGMPAVRRPGEAYAGRTVCHLESARDLDVTFGDSLLSRLAPLEALLLSARWLTAALAEACTHLLTGLFHDLCAESGAAEVPFCDLWYLAVGSLLGREPLLDKVLDDFVARWSAALGLESLAPECRRLDLDPDDLLGKARGIFAAERPGWADAKVHSPDVLISASSPEAVRAGDFAVILGEFHIAIAALDTHFFALGHPDPAELADAMRATVKSDRVHLLTPPEWPRQSARNAVWLKRPGDVQLGYCPADGADPARLLPITELTVSAHHGGLAARSQDGRQWPLIEMFASVLGVRVFDAWKLVGVAAHTPRVTIGSLVVIRESWQMTASETGLAKATGARERYLAVRRLRQRFDLPDLVFAKIEGEEKPCYMDLTSPIYARIFCGMIRKVVRQVGPQASVCITEMLPTPDRSWLTDSGGNRYSSELRIHICDPADPFWDGDE